MEQIDKDYKIANELFGDCREDVLSFIDGLTGHEQIFMKYLYAYMPLSDVGMYSVDVIYSYAKHGAFLFEQSKFSEKIELEYFLNYVLSHRINSEDITVCRPFFYELVWERVKDLSLVDAILEVNQWCYEQATYRSTSERTASPLTVYYGGFGRCGEESTFLTTVLRSIGIASRQIYAPRWSHSDSNHAWVEVLVDGTWYYTGACEPKPILNNGWFPYAASRAMVTLARLFTGIHIDGEIVEKDGIVTAINRTELYALNKKLLVRVRDELDRPVENALIRFEIVNSSEFFPVASLHTDPKGEGDISLGLGDVYVVASYEKEDSSYVVHRRFVRVNEVEEILFRGEGTVVPYEIWQDYKITAPESHVIASVDMTKEQEAFQDERNKLGDQIRNQRIASYFDVDFYKQYEGYEGIKQALDNAKGNLNTIKEFILTLVEGISLEDKNDLLSLLATKDCRDISLDALVDHLDGLKYRSDYKEDIFLKYVYSPRISIELITPYRSFIRNYVKENGLEFQHPLDIWTYVDKAIAYYKEREYTTIMATPSAALKLKAGTTRAKHILFVAICRTFGFAARLDPIYLLPQYYEMNEFHFIHQKANSRVRFVSEKIEPSYYGNFTVGKKEEDGSFTSLGLYKERFIHNEMEVSLLKGEYRIVTCERMSSGSIVGKMYYFTLEEGEEKTITLSFRGLKAEDFITRYELPSFTLRKKDNNMISSKELQDAGDAIFIWTDASKEPTEHIFNELLDIKMNQGFPECNLNFIIKDSFELLDDTFKKILKEFPWCNIYFDDYTDNLAKLSLATKVDGTKLPFVLVTEGVNKGVFACSGYRVGSGDILYKLIKK